MDYREIHTVGPVLELHGLRNFSIDDIFDCGQCFRWHKEDEKSWRGTVRGLVRTITQRGDTLLLHGVSEQEFHAVWQDYFDFGRDYGLLKDDLMRDSGMVRAIAFTPGMRVLRQQPWEALCSFIISANNNIQRIRGIVERLCELLGEPIEGGYAFPTAQQLASCSVQDLAPVRCGYRAAYLIDAGRLVSSGELRLETLYAAPISEARTALRQIKGVGPKVAECALLYGFARAECVPVDVWIGRVMQALYPNGFPPELRAIAGLGQQYLFHYVRNCPDALLPEACPSV